MRYIEFIEKKPKTESYFLLEGGLQINTELVLDLSVICGLDPKQELKAIIAEEQKILNIEPYTDDEWNEIVDYINEIGKEMGYRGI